MSRSRNQHRSGLRHDDGSAIIEFVFVAVLVLVPLVYLLVVVAEVQRSRLAVTNAARDIGRAIEARQADLDADAAAALRLALRGQRLRPEDVEVRYVASHRDCSAEAITPDLAEGSEFTVCVTRHQQLPGVPVLMEGRPIATVGRYVVHRDNFRKHR